MADVFVSYSREDRERLESLIALLEQQGWSVWWDERLLSGSIFANDIEAALTAAGCVLVVWSCESTKSRWVLAEAQAGLDRDALIAVLLDEVEIPLPFRPVHTIRPLNPDGTLRAQEAASLLQAISARLGKPVAHRPAVGAFEPPRISLLGATTWEIEDSKHKTQAMKRFYRALLAAIERTPYGLSTCGAEPLRRAFFESYCERLYHLPPNRLKEIDWRVRWYWYPGDSTGLNYRPAFFESCECLDAIDRDRRELEEAKLLVAFTGRTGTRTQVESLLAEHQRGDIDLNKKKLVLLGWFGGSIKSLIDERQPTIQWLLNSYKELEPDQEIPDWHQDDMPRLLAERLVRTLQRLLLEASP